MRPSSSAIGRVFSAVRSMSRPGAANPAPSALGRASAGLGDEAGAEARAQAPCSQTAAEAASKAGDPARRGRRRTPLVRRLSGGGERRAGGPSRSGRGRRDGHDRVRALEGPTSAPMSFAAARGAPAYRRRAPRSRRRRTAGRTRPRARHHGGVAAARDQPGERRASPEGSSAPRRRSRSSAPAGRVSAAATSLRSSAPPRPLPTDRSPALLGEQPRLAESRKRAHHHRVSARRSPRPRRSGLCERDDPGAPVRAVRAGSRAAPA